MAKLIEMKPNTRRPALRLALVVSSSKPPPDASSITDRGTNRTFYADTTEHDIGIMVERAKVWADEQSIPNVYLSRET
jgi:hypothetical protein